MIPNFTSYRFCFSLLLSLMATVGWSQSSSIDGVVVEPSENQPIEFSSISLHRVSDSTQATGAVSDALGKFTLQDVKEGKYYVVAQFLGYESKTISDITVSSNQKINLGTVSLQPRETLLNEIVVTGQKATSFHQIDKQVYTAANFQASQGGNAIEVLRNLPSLSVNAEGEISLRGSAGFIILLDGKPTQADPLVILNQLPANSIENIEIITTPSSKFDPDGKAGIINISTKKGTTDGYFILLNAQGGLPSVQDYGNENGPMRFGGDITSNIRKGKLNVSLSGNYKRDDIAGYRDGEATTYHQNTITELPSLGERSYTSYSYGFRGTANYQVNTRNALEVGFYSGKKSQFRKANIVYDQQRTDALTGEEINSLRYFNKNQRERKGDFLVANMDFTHTFKNKGTILVSGLYERTILGGPTRNTDVDVDNENTIYNDAHMREENPLDGFRLKGDYALPLGQTVRLEAGYQYRYLLHKGSFAYNQLDPASGNWFLRDDLSNEIRLMRHIHSLYSQVSGEIGKLSYSGGVRLEQVDRTLKDDGVATPYQFDRLNLFPSANLLYKLEKGYKLKAGYSRRISHTTSNMMNPFPARRHSEVFEIGDPNLLPEYIDVAEVGAVKDLGSGSLFVNLYYRNTKNVINRVNSVYNDTILYRTFTNAGNGTSVGLEVGADLKLAEWWTFFAGGNVYNYAIKGNVLGATVSTSGVNYSINGNTSFKLQPSLILQLTLNYTSETVTAQGNDSKFLIPTATLKKTILKGQGSLSLQWQNIDLGWLESNEQRITTTGDGFYSSTNYIQEVDIFRLNFSYQLNKLGKKLKFTESEFGEKEF